MQSDLRAKTAKSIIWSTIDKGGFQIVALLVGIITARLLSVDDFGLIGALAMFTQLSNVLIESGFSAALVRRKVNTDSEYSAAFYFNIGISLLFYVLLFVSAPLIATYFQMPELERLSRFLFLAIIVYGFGIIPNIILTKRLEFRKIMISNLSSAIVAGIVAILLALKGFGYWAIAWQQLLQAVIRVLVQWFLVNWHPVRHVQWGVIRELFSFSFVLIITSVVTNVVRYIYNWIIGKWYSKTDLGYYSQAFKFQNIPSQVVATALTGVAYPVISSLNETPERQLLYLRKLVRVSAFLIFPLMLGLMGVAENMIEILLTAKWLPLVPYFKIMVFAAMFAPFQSLCLNTLNAVGKPKWNFLLEMLRNALVIISVIVCRNSITHMLYGYVVAQIIAYILDVVLVGRCIKYSLFDHLKDIAPYVFIAALMFLVIYIIDYFIANIYLSAVVQLVCGASIYLILTAASGSTVYKDAIMLLRSKKLSV